MSFKVIAVILIISIISQSYASPTPVARYGGGFGRGFGGGFGGGYGLYRHPRFYRPYYGGYRPYPYYGGYGQGGGVLVGGIAVIGVGGGFGK